MEHVLIVEDSPEIAALMSLTLRMEGYEVSQASNGASALELLQKFTPDLILMDVMMPGLSGFQVADQIKTESRLANVPIIFVTAKHEINDLIQGLEVAVDYISKPFAVPELLARVRAAMRMRKLQTQLEESNAQLSQLAITDGLTGLLNRRGFDRAFEDEIWRARRFGHALGLVIFDIDRFKTVNDTYGHPQGDVVLQSFGEILMNSSRRVDKVARFGGEEFALLLPATDQIGVQTVCEKVRATTEGLPVSCPKAPGGEIRVTVSGGGVIIPHFGEHGARASDIATAMFALADKCLYQAKENGRNRIVTRLTNDEEISSLT